MHNMHSARSAAQAEDYARFAAQVEALSISISISAAEARAPENKWKKSL